MVASRAARAEVRVCVSVEEGEVEREAVEAEAGRVVLERLREVVGWEWVDAREGGGMGEGTWGGAVGVEGGRAVDVRGAGVGLGGFEVGGRADEGMVGEASTAVDCSRGVSLGPLSAAAAADSSDASLDIS